jgi:putative membrane protein
MQFHGGWFLGVHLLWWLVGVVLIFALFPLFAPVSRYRGRETPLAILQRRYAAGEISSDEYEERKAKLERDAPSAQK